MGHNLPAADHSVQHDDIATESVDTDISIIVPLMNEADAIEELVDRVSQVLTQSERSFEILLVDDGSTDGSTEIVERICNERSNVHGIIFRRNFGKAQALTAGFRYARGRLIFTMDADLQDVPEEIPKFLAKMDRGFDLVSGWKVQRQDPLSKRLPSKLFNLVLSFMVGNRLHDVNCGFKCYRREIIEDIELYGELHRYVVVLAHALGYRVAEIEITHAARRHGASKYGVERLPKGFFDLLTVLLTTRYFDRPLHFFGGIGLALLTVGVLLLLYISVGWFLGETIAGRPLFFLGILLVVVGGQVVSTGLLAELFVKSRSENRSVLSIRKTINL